MTRFPVHMMRRAGPRGPAGPPISGYTVWFHADGLGLTDGASVVQLADSSTNGYHATQGTAGARGTFVANAVGGKPAVYFDGTKWYAIAGTPTVGTLFVVCNHTGGATFSTIQRILDGNDNAGFSLFGDDGLGGQDYNFAVGHTYLRNLSASQAWINGAAYTTAAPLASYRVISAVLTPTNPVSQPIWVGTVIGLGVQNVIGNVAEYVLYPTALSEANRQSVESYLKSKYGIT